MNIAEVFDMDHLDKTGELKPLADVPAGRVAEPAQNIPSSIDDNVTMSRQARREQNDTYWSRRLGPFGLAMAARYEEADRPPPPDTRTPDQLSMAEYAEARARFGMTDKREGFIVG